MTFKVVVIGDAHGNPLKILQHLHNEGLITNYRELYGQLLDSYKNNNVRAFIQLLEQLSFSGLEERQKTQIMLLGDLLADRGQNDIMMLSLFRVLTEQHVQYNVVFSNHDREFLRNLESIRQQRYKNIRVTIDPKQARW
ncbi:metallophosphoesterase [Piscirickettsia salmonis]|uniref:metallophosphoesterase n=1 Tax=Piscirickettsia salmonis TaxID=1238 RepID=UPI000F094432|nr:hypothetical protein DA717_09645 [Piscirickettsiaceae bacterium NZ-RLO2]